MPNRILALDPHGAQLVAVVVETSFRSYQVVGFFAEPRDPNAPLSDQLRSFVARHAITADTVLSALPDGRRHTGSSSCPFVTGESSRKRCHSNSKARCPSPSTKPWSTSRSSNGPGRARVFAALAPRAKVEEHLQILADAGLDPAIVDFAPLTTLNVLQLFEGERPDRYAFLHVSSGQQGTLAIYRGGQLTGLRVIDVAGEPEAPAFAREIAWSLKSLNGSPPGGDDEAHPS